MQTPINKPQIRPPVLARGTGKKKEVLMQDNDSNPLILPLVNELGAHYLISDGIIDSYEVELDSVAGISLGDHFRIINANADRFYSGTVLAIDGNIITLDDPLDFAFISGSEITYSSMNMAVDGSVTPVHFHLRTGNPSIPSSVDITRMIMVCECDNAVDLNKFGDITGGLTKGLLLRYTNRITRNIFNIKTNKDMANLGYDFDPYSSSNPALGINGFAWRLTFNGPEKMGVVLRITQHGQIGFIVKDDLSSLVSLVCYLEGHIVIN